LRFGQAVRLFDQRGVDVDSARFVR
jgi:hypothetical protein